MLNIRRWHSYLGLLIAPSVLFFSLTGAVQLFGLHESRGVYRPAALVEKLSSVHKDQEFTLGHHGGSPPAAETASQSAVGAPASIAHDGDAGQHDGSDAGQHDSDKVEQSTTLLKWYFLIVAIALTTSTCLGIRIGLTQIRKPALAWTLLVVGTVVPVALLLA